MTNDTPAIATLEWLALAPLAVTGISFFLWGRWADRLSMSSSPTGHIVVFGLLLGVLLPSGAAWLLYLAAWVIKGVTSV